MPGPEFGDASVWPPELECSHAHSSAILLGELVIHGYDIARTVDAPWPITRREAIAIFEGALVLLPLVYDGSATEGRTFTMDVRLRGRSGGLGLHCTPSPLTINNGSPPNAAVHISADPVGWILIGYGRRSQLWGAYTGLVRVWGRKPWLALRFGRLFPSP
ncbi:MAG: hypothetical protein WEA75_07900 [Acidimicrobiia bacterium]